MKKLFVLILGLSFIFSSCSRVDKDILVFTGSVEADEYDISSEISSMLEEVFVEKGDLVNKGDKLFKLNSKDLDIALKKAVISSEIAKLSYEDLKNGNSENLINKSKYSMESLKEQIAGSKKNIEYLEKNYNKILELYKNGAETEQSLDNAKRALDLETSKYDSLNKQYLSLRNQYLEVKKGVDFEILEKARLAYELSKVNIENIEYKISKTKVYSPINAVVKSVNYKKGEYIMPVNKVVSLVDLDSIYIKIYVPEKELYKINLGDEVKFKDEFLSEKKVTGKITYISSKAEFTPKNIESKENKQEMVYEVRIKIFDNEEIIKPGMFLDVQILSKS